MKTREDYVKHLKDQLDRWNADVTKWEAQVKSAKADMKARYEKDLEGVRAQREKALYQLKLLEKASATAWADFTKGADEAWDRMRKAVDQARTHFEKTPK